MRPLLALIALSLFLVGMSPRVSTAAPGLIRAWGEFGTGPGQFNNPYGIVVDDSALAGRFVPVSGGWADAGDYLQYVATSATATSQMLMAWRDHPASFGDAFDARGLPGANGTPDVLDEARHGLEWLRRMFPEGGPMFNQLGDDRDHSFLDLPTTDSSDYGWGKGRERPVYPCTGRPQGLLRELPQEQRQAQGLLPAAFADC